MPVVACPSPTLVTPVPSPLPVEGGSFLSQWRQAVSMATSASQLSVCMAQLERSIAWEKSLLKVVSLGKQLCGPWTRDLIVG